LEALREITKSTSQYQRIEPLVFDILSYLEKIIQRCDRVQYLDYMINFLE